MCQWQVALTRLDGLAVLLATALVAVLAARPAKAQLQFTSPDGKQVFKIGILGQLQAESIENGNAADDSANNLFLRRLRLLGNFKLSDQLTVFFDTDSPNLGQAGTRTARRTTPTSSSRTSSSPTPSARSFSSTAACC